MPEAIIHDPGESRYDSRDKVFESLDFSLISRAIHLKCVDLVGLSRDRGS
jgi:hypothetical protein